MRYADTISLRLTSLALVIGTVLWSSTAAAQTPKHHQASRKGHGALVFDTLSLRQDSTPLTQLAAATRAARRQGRTPIVEIGASWCGPCHALEDVLEGSDMRTAMQQMYVVSLDIDQWHNALANLGFDVNTGIPRIAMIDSTGHPVGEPWRPRDVPDSLTDKLGMEGAWRVTLTALFAKAREQFHQTPLASPPAGSADTGPKHKDS